MKETGTFSYCLNELCGLKGIEIKKENYSEWRSCEHFICCSFLGDRKICAIFLKESLEQVDLRIIFKYDMITTCGKMKIWSGKKANPI